MRNKIRKTLQILCLIAIILSLLLFLKTYHNQWPMNKIGGDFTSYWASARLLLDGQNPYQSDKIFELEKSAGWIDEKPTVMYNPPWALTYIIPFASSNYELAKFIWLLFLFICILICLIWLWKFYGGTDADRNWSLLILFTYVPFYYTFVRGQIVPLIILGIAGFLHFERQKKCFLAGVFVCLIGIKPQVTYLFFMALLFWILYKKQWNILFGAGCATLFTTAIPVLYNPDIYFQYYSEILTQSYQYYWHTPTIGYFLRSLLDKEKYFFQYLPTTLGVAWLFYHWHRNYTKWVWAEQIPLLIFMSLMTSFYLWIHDYLLLLIAIIQASVWLLNNTLRFYSKFLIFLYVLIISMTWVTVLSVRSEKWIAWMVPALFINYLLIKIFYTKTNSNTKRLSIK